MKHAHASTMPLDWCGEILGHHDIGIAMVEALGDIEDIVAMSRVCKAIKPFTDEALEAARLLAGLHSVRKLDAAARKGNLRMVRWFFKALRDHPAQRKITFERACGAAAEHGHVPILVYLRSAGATFTHHTCACAASHGQLDCLKWLYANGVPSGGLVLAPLVVAGAARARDPACLKYVLGLGCRGNELAMGGAAELPDATNMELLHATGTWVSEFSMRRAAERGRLENLKWLHARSKERLIPRGVVNAAAMHGRCDCLEYAHKNGAQLNGNELRQALRCCCYYGDLDCVAYLVSVGAEIDFLVIKKAVELGNTKLIDGFVANGHHPDEEHMRFALERTELGEIEDRNWKVDSVILACLRRHGVQWPEDTIDHILNVSHGSFAWDHHQFTTFRKAVTYGARITFKHKKICCARNFHDAVRFLAEKGYSFDDDGGELMHTAVVHDSLYCVEVLRRMGVRCNREQKFDLRTRQKKNDYIGEGYINSSHEYMALGFPDSWLWRFPFWNTPVGHRKKYNF